MNTKVFEYKGSRITFNAGDSVMINATEMAKPFGKRPVDWLNLSSTIRYIDTLREVRFPNITPDESSGLVEAYRGNFSDGKPQGTWMNEDVALEFARWLSPQFAIWCNDRIKELMKHGFTATPERLEQLIENPDLVIKLATELKSEREKRHLAETTIRKQAPKVAFAEAVDCNPGSILVRQYAKTLCDRGFNIGEKRLFQWLRNNGYLNHNNEPYQRYVDMGLFETQPYSHNTPDGQWFKFTTKITGKGQVYFAGRLIPNQQLTIAHG